MAYKFTYNEQSFCEDVMAYATRYHKKFERFYDSFYNGEELEIKAKLHAIYHYTLNLTSQSRKERGCFLKDIHRNLRELENDGIPENYDYFSSKLKKMNCRTIQEVIIHSAKGVPRYESRTSNPILIDYAEVLYAKSLCKYPEIYKKVKIKAKKHRIDELTIDHIKKHFAQPKVQSRLRPIRNGKEWYRDNTSKQQHFTKPEFAGQLLEIDGSRLQIPFNNVKLKKIDFLVLFIILDVTSRLVLGYAHGLYEKSVVAKNAFRRYFENYSFLPLQITRDGASTYEKDFKIVETLTTKRGVQWIVTHDPQGKPHV